MFGSFTYYIHPINGVNDCLIRADVGLDSSMAAHHESAALNQVIILP